MSVCMWERERERKKESRSTNKKLIIIPMPTRSIHENYKNFGIQYNTEEENNTSHF